MIQDLFFELIQITLGNRDKFSTMPSEKEWEQLYMLATKQSLTSVFLEGVNRIKNNNPDVNLNQSLVLEWIGVGLQTEAYNKVQNKRAKELYELFKERGYRSVVLKGQGTAQYYPHTKHRACGDIDLWVESDRDEILDFVRKSGYPIDSIDIKHAEIRFFDDVPVEIHFLPSWMYSPIANRRLQRFFSDKADGQFAAFDGELGFAHTTIDFDLVYSMVHIYRHIFSEGIGLRQLMDYYFILQRSTAGQRQEAFDVLCRLKMKDFVGGIMWILREDFGMKEDFSLCQVNERHGRFLLSEIMAAGSFGHFDTRITQINRDKRFKRGFSQLKRNLRFVTYYPSEVLWSPVWKLWHWCWRKRKGYL